MYDKNSSNLRILHITASLSSGWGGPPRVAVQLAEAIQFKGHSCSIFTTDFPKAEPKIATKNIQVSIFPTRFIAKWWPAYSTDLSRALTQSANRFDIIHIHEIWHYANYAAFRAAKHHNIPYVITMHGALQDWAINYKARKKKLYMRLIMNQILKQANGLHVFTDNEAQQLKNFNINNTLAIIPNGTDISSPSLPHSRISPDRWYPELKGRKYILFLGRIHPIKGLYVLVKAFSKVHKNQIFESVKLVVAGPDENNYRRTLTDLLKSEGALQDTIFTGMVKGKEKQALLEGADVYVQPSYSEGFSASVLEALARKIPVVISEKCNFQEVAESHAGFVVTPDIDQLTSAIIKLLDNPDMRKKMGENGKRLIINKYSWDRIAQDMILFYRSLM